MVTLKEALKGKLTEKQISLVPKSFDVVGDILIFSDFPEELKKEREGHWRNYSQLDEEC